MTQTLPPRSMPRQPPLRNLTRRRALQFAGLAALAATGARAQGIEMRYAALAAPGSGDEKMWLEFAARAAKSGLDQRLSLVPLIYGELQSEEGMLTALRRNRVQMAGVSLAGGASIVPELAVLQAPYLFATVEEVDWVVDNRLTEAVRALCRERGLFFSGFGNIGWVNLFSRGAPIRTVAEAKGRRLRAPASFAAQEFLRAVGADTTYLPFADIIPSLQTGLIDGGATSTTQYDKTGVSIEAPYLSLTRHQHDLGVYVINASWHDRLDAEVKALLAQDLPSAADSRAVSRAAEVEALANFAGRGITTYEPTEAERAEWQAAAAPATERLIERIGDGAQAFYDQIIAAKADYAALAKTPAEGATP